MDSIQQKGEEKQIILENWNEQHQDLIFQRCNWKKIGERSPQKGRPHRPVSLRADGVAVPSGPSTNLVQVTDFR
jgi:hypothetical protein